MQLPDTLWISSLMGFPSASLILKTAFMPLVSLIFSEKYTWNPNLSPTAAKVDARLVELSSQLVGAFLLSEVIMLPVILTEVKVGYTLSKYVVLIHF